MEQQRGECCVDRYPGGAYDLSKVDLIMLKFRPIAPKPPSADGSVSGSAGSVAVPAKSVRVKRRYGPNGGITARKANRRRKASPETTDSGGSVKTLPLLPVEPYARPLWLRVVGGGGRTAAAEAVKAWVRVERVTDTWEGEGSMTDEERAVSLDRDTCPGFISDGEDRVRWTNAAFGRMVAAAERVVVVVERGVVLPAGCGGFTCWVRVVTCGEKDKTLPCDVWRMDCGGFAWRLDTAAALSLWFGAH